MPHTRFRFAALLFALLHLTVQPLATLADAWVHRDAARSGPAVVHIESHGTPDCARVHPVDCALCGLAASLAIPPLPRHALPAAVSDTAVAIELRIGRAGTDHFTLALPRAPPVA